MSRNFQESRDHAHNLSMFLSGFPHKNTRCETGDVDKLLEMIILFWKKSSFSEQILDSYQTFLFSINVEFIFLTCKTKWYLKFNFHHHELLKVFKHFKHKMENINYNQYNFHLKFIKFFFISIFSFIKLNWIFVLQVWFMEIPLNTLVASGGLLLFVYIYEFTRL